jgi:aspartate/methionine/tyrosine aminotransferase
MSLSLQSVQPAYIACEEGFVPSLASAREILSSAASSSGPVRPRAIVLTTPNNPTGAIYAPESLLEWYALAREFSVALVLDETYRDFNPSPHGLFADKEWRETVVSLGSFSSAYLEGGVGLGGSGACRRERERAVSLRAVPATENGETISADDQPPHPMAPPHSTPSTI